MYKKLISSIKPVLRSLLGVVLVLALTLGPAGDAMAARGGRIGGGSFRAPAPSRNYSAPRTYAPGGGYGGYGGGYYPGGGGFGFPFLLPVFGGGFGVGGLFSILIFLAVANFLVQSFRRVRGGDELGGETYTSDSTISVAKLQVGLLSQARELQTDLNRIAQNANTGSTTGLAEVLQEASLALLRHPEYWAYAGSGVQQARLESAEVQFNRLVLAERSKFSGETLSNVNNQLKQAPIAGQLAAAGGALADTQAPGEYIVVTLLVGAQGNLKLPKVNSPDELRQALQQLGGVSSDRLLALEVLWTPQAEGDVLTSEDLLVEYPELKLI
ncbi:MAG TPA: DUF1517 domain-containing protein [Thermosynechococcaceae cyanobacterium]